MLRQLCFVKPNPPKWEGLKHISFNNHMRWEKIEWGPAHLKCSVFRCILVLDLGDGDAAYQLYE